jgi:hypothetical protein
MSGLGEFLKAVAEGKSHYEENDPKGIQQKQIREVAKKEAKIGLADLFKELASLKQQVEQVENQSQENIDIPIGGMLELTDGKQILLSKEDGGRVMLVTLANK